MKNLVIAVFVFFITAKISAQDVSLTQTGNISHNQFYVDLVGKTASLNGNWGLFGGMKAGYNINKNVSLGLAGYGLIPNHLGGSYINQSGRDTLHFGYGGAEATYKYNFSEKFSLAGMMMIGAGRVDYENLGGYDYFFIMEPGVAFNYMITEWFGLGVSADYRFAAGVNYADFSDASFSGWSTDLSFKFGF
jgi:hypothetical protein